MKQSMSSNLVVSIVLLVILCAVGLGLCVQWNIGGYCPLTIVVCTIGVLLLAAYADKVEEQEAQVSVLLSQAFTTNATPQVHTVQYSDKEVQEMGSGITQQEASRWANSYEEWKEKHCN